MVVRAQLVADGQTNVLDGVATNLTGGVTVGTNGTFTLLVITNGATVTNSSGNSVIGYNASAQSNRVVVAQAGSVWNNNGAIYVGQNGSASEMDILNGGLVTDTGGSIGQTSASSNNLVLVSGAGSMWTNSSSLVVGNGSSHNMLIVTNGGKVFSGSSGVGENAFGVSSNNVFITGPGSSWSSGYFYLGYSASGHNQFLINNGGTFTTSSTLDIGGYDNSNLLTVADAGSSVQCQSFRMSYASTGNQCVVSNGATLAVALSSQPTTVEGTFTAATVTGAGSVWTNAGDLDFGQYSNVLSITSGGMMVDNNGYIENGSGKPNTVIVAGTNSLWENLGDLHVADLSAQLFITNGAMVVDKNAYVGENAGNNNCYVLVAGAGSMWTNRNAYLDGNDEGSLYLGKNGATNTLMVTDSGKVAAPNIYISNNGRLVVMNSGTLQAVRDIWNGSSGGLYVGYTGGSPNQLVITNGGVVTVSGTMQIGNFGGGQNSNSVTIDGSSLVVSNGFTIASPGTLVLNSGTCRVGSFSIYNYQQQTNAIVLNGGTLQAGGIAYGSFSYPETLVVGDGIHPATFQMQNNGTFSGGFSVVSNAWLTGAGTINGNVTVWPGGTFAPGITNLATVTLNGGLVLNNGGTNFMGLLPSTGSACNIQGVTNVTYGGTLQLTNLGGSYASGQSYQLFSATQYNGAFSNLVPATPGNGLRWDTWQLNVNGTLRIFSTNTPPPVVSSVALAGTNLTMTTSAGISYDPCYLLTSTNLATPLSGWSCAATNYFDVNGTTSFTNTISPDEPARYFQLQVN
jgi:T5SS/PEP-CTERM-associated repeat protein